jgi:hypothetical protein
MGELAYPKERPIMTSLFNALWFVGSLVAAGLFIPLTFMGCHSYSTGISFGTQSLSDDWAWRIPSILQMAPSLLQIIFILYVFRTQTQEVEQGTDSAEV